MCGIVGISGVRDRNLIVRMSNQIQHRGPDDFGIFEDGDTSIAMHRLAIIDSEHGIQPMTSEDGRFTLVFNGEIFNSKDLRVRLTNCGRRFRTSHSDTEVLLMWLLEFGHEGLDKLNGMFAFALWDSQKRELLLARDRFGIKPLYYHYSQGIFSFASEMKSLLALDFVSREVNLKSLYHYMSLMFVVGEDSIISGISRLTPGSLIRFREGYGVVEQSKWWEPVIGRGPPLGEHDTSEAIIERFTQAADRWATSDAPFACSLSGGLDSSALVAVLAKRGHKLRTYSLGFSDPYAKDLDELKVAQKVACMWNTEHHEIVVSSSDLIGDLLRMVWHLDEPYGGGLPSWMVFKKMAEGSNKVALTGTGGDELFGNYGKWLLLEGGFFRKHILNKRSVAFSEFKKKYFDRNYYLKDDEKRKYVFAFECSKLDSSKYLFQKYFLRSENSEIHDRSAYLDISTQLPEEFLFMTDRFSMAHSVEARTPFLDSEFSDFVLNIPSGQRTTRKDVKSLLRSALSNFIPREVLQQKKKGFVLPVGDWLRNELRPLAEYFLEPRRLAHQGFFQPDFYGAYVLPHMLGRRNNTQIIWAALMFQLWHMRFLEQNSGPVPSLLDL